MHQTPPAEIQITEALVRGLLREQHPDLAELPIRLLDSGWDNFMFQLGEDLLLRFPRREIAVRLIKNEQQWLPALQKNLPIPIPAPLRVGRPGRGYPWPWSILQYLRGISAEQEAPDGSQAEIFGAFLQALHQLAPNDAPDNPLRGVPLRERAAHVEARMQRLVMKTNLITPALRQIWQLALAASLHTEDRWLHGDLHPRNVIVHEGRITGIIDWGDITSGDVATDLAAIWMLFSEQKAREKAFLTYQSLDQPTLLRAKGWAIFFGVVLLDAGLTDDERLARIGARTLERLLADEQAKNF